MLVWLQGNREEGGEDRDQAGEDAQVRAPARASGFPEQRLQGAGRWLSVPAWEWGVLLAGLLPPLEDRLRAFRMRSADLLLVLLAFPEWVGLIGTGRASQIPQARPRGHSGKTGEPSLEVTQ